MLFIPLLDRVILPAWSRMTTPSPSRPRWLSALYPTALRRMGLGMLLAAGSFMLSAGVAQQVASQGDGKVPVAWMIPQYAMLACGEILTSTTGACELAAVVSSCARGCACNALGLEFAFSQAPAPMKGVVTALFQTTTGIGDLLTGMGLNR